MRQMGLANHTLSQNLVPYAAQRTLHAPVWHSTACQAHPDVWWCDPSLHHSHYLAQQTTTHTRHRVGMAEFHSRHMLHMHMLKSWMQHIAGCMVSARLTCSSRHGHAADSHQHYGSITAALESPLPASPRMSQSVAVCCCAGPCCCLPHGMQQSVVPPQALQSCWCLRGRQPQQQAAAQSPGRQQHGDITLQARVSLTGAQGNDRPLSH